MLLNEFEITYMLMNKLIESKKILKTTNDGIFSYYLNNISDNTCLDSINYIPIILKFIRDYDKSKILDSNIDLDIILDHIKNENLLLIILKIICFFIIKNNENIELIINHKIKDYKPNKKKIYNYNTLRKSSIDYSDDPVRASTSVDVDNQYVELTVDLSKDNYKNIILETETEIMKHNNIWITTTNNTESESSEIDVSKICF